MEAKVNERVEKKRVKFSNMIYIGDGVTDIPCMTLVKEKGGTAIAVYNENRKAVTEECVKNNVSIGGSADILICAYLMNKLKQNFIF